MLEARDAEVIEIRPFDVHGVGHVDVTLAWSDGGVEVVRLGAESVAEGLEPGARVSARLVMSTVVAIERSPTDER